MTSSRWWKIREGQAAAIFGSRRQRCSGSSGIEAETCSDSTHPRIYIEHKLRASHSILSVWRAAKKQAHKEGKDPVVVLSEKGRQGQWLLIHESDMAAIVANWLASQDEDVASSVYVNASRYSTED